MFLRGITTKCFEEIVKTRVKTISGGDVGGNKKSDTLYNGNAAHYPVCGKLRDL